MADNNTKNDKKTNNDTADTDNDTNDTPYIPTPVLDPNSADSSEEVTPGNVQAPLNDDDKLKQDNVLAAEHIEKGYPADMVPRTEEERRRMEDEGLIDKAA